MEFRFEIVCVSNLALCRRSVRESEPLFCFHCQWIFHQRSHTAKIRIRMLTKPNGRLFLLKPSQVLPWKTSDCDQNIYWPLCYRYAHCLKFLIVKYILILTTNMSDQRLNKRPQINANFPKQIAGDLYNNVMSQVSAIYYRMSWVVYSGVLFEVRLSLIKN